MTDNFQESGLSTTFSNSSEEMAPNQRTSVSIDADHQARLREMTHQSNLHLRVEATMQAFRDLLEANKGQCYRSGITDVKADKLRLTTCFQCGEVRPNLVKCRPFNDAERSDEPHEDERHVYCIQCVQDVLGWPSENMDRPTFSYQCRARCRATQRT